jgi:hypothetical protein
MAASRYQIVKPGAHQVHEIGTSSEVEYGATCILQPGQSIIEPHCFVVQLVNASTEAAQIGNKVGVILQDVADSIEV